MRVRTARTAASTSEHRDFRGSPWHVQRDGPPTLSRWTPRAERPPHTRRSGCCPHRSDEDRRTRQSVREPLLSAGVLRRSRQTLWRQSFGDATFADPLNELSTIPTMFEQKRDEDETSYEGPHEQASGYRKNRRSQPQGSDGQQEDPSHGRQSG